MLVDTHTHLNAAEFDDDRAEVISRARSAGVDRMVVIGFDLTTSLLAVELAEQHDGLFATVGIHPCYVNEAEADDADTVEGLFSHPKVVGIGETGIDLHWDKSTYDLQEKYFRLHLDWGRRYNMPVIVHDREAHDEILTILETENAADLSVILHCFTGDLAMMEKATAAGFYLGFGGIATFKNADLGDVISSVPSDRILVETDAPYLAPTPYRGRRNEPAYVVNTAEALARHRGLSLEELALITTRNAERVFKYL